MAFDSDPTMFDILVEHQLGRMTFDTCKEASRRTVKSLRRRGVDARWIQFMGLAVPAPDADPRWSEIPPASRIHYVVKIGERYIDGTARQFWPDGPEVVVSADYSARWDREYDITDALED